MEQNGKTVKVIIETVLLSDEEKVKASELAVVDFVKTSTGFVWGGATPEDEINERYSGRRIRG